LGFMSDGLSVRSDSKKPPLHWPAWIWIVGNLIFAAIFITMLAVRMSRAIDAGWEITFQVYWQQAKFVSLIILLDLIAAITMLINRKVGLIAAFVRLAEMVYNRIYMSIKDLSKGELLVGLQGKSDYWFWAALFLIIMFGIPIFWLIYFILARKRYWPPKSNPDIFP
jgi:hypothetical protein